MANVCIKGIKDADWLYFKSEAAKAGKTMGEYFNSLIVIAKNRPKSNWSEILYRKPTLTDKEAKEMLGVINKAFRTETEFR